MFIVSDVENAVGLFTAIDQPLYVVGAAERLFGNGPEVMREIVRLPRERPHRISLAALKNQDPSAVPFLGQAASGDCTAETASDHNRFVVFLHQSLKRKKRPAPSN